MFVCQWHVLLKTVVLEMMKIYHPEIVWLSLKIFHFIDKNRR